PFDWVFHDDACASWCDWLKVWSNDMTTMRIHSRVAHLLDPAHLPDPWNIVNNSQPNSPDQRLGDGTYRGGAKYAKLISAVADTHTVKRGGLDYVWSTDPEIQNKSRGAWHPSAVGQVRYRGLGTGGGHPAGLLQELQYEQDVELPGSNTAPFYNQRRIDKLEPLTPHQMPVPAKELGVLKLSLYTCGGASHPDGSCDAHPAPSAVVAAL